MKAATSKEMQLIDKKSISDYGIPGIVLMENAAIQVVREMEVRYGDLSGERITIFAGKGNNGGDGLAIARHLMNKGSKVSVYLLAMESSIEGDALTNLKIFKRMGGEMNCSDSFDPDILKNAISCSNLVVDAIFGTGLSSDVKGFHADVISLINSARKPTVSVDIPSGISADTGNILGAAVRADLTVTFGLPKIGLLVYPGAGYTGELKIVDISIPKVMKEVESLQTNLLTIEEVRGMIPERMADSHKGSFGHVGVIAGSVGKTGAAAMASLASLKVGAGIVSLAAPSSLNRILAQKLTEVMTFPLPEGREGFIGSQAEGKILEFLSDKDVAAIGPGISTDKGTQELMRRLVKSVSLPIVIDADGINAFVGYTDLLKNAGVPLILTPHPGEMAGLLGIGPSDVQADRIGISRRFASEYHLYLVLKGARTIIAEPSGAVYINPTGNPGMATAGTGDILTGIIAGLVAQRLDMGNAVRLGVFLHGLAGDMAAKEMGEAGMIAGDLMNMIPGAIRYIKGVN